ncbi:putative RNA-directed DNA polymerase [Helianthus annuus]|nr:putative RNA-directed DNA polymerase [Helianthus annuus]KAJ0498680.1 putative RNA-directed DNA polymerase [Helianthus annuus]KAJ0664694.1 putative RNA-directed DNA polymerase [Helianthus annuus]KAJ0672143.1 putative RNA-directed DNA polymerase [Helianthus annuus]
MISRHSLPVTNSVFPFCNSCPMGKSKKMHLSSSNYKSSCVLDLVFCDVWGPTPVTSFYGHRYFLLGVDHYTRYMWLFPLKQKSDVFTTFKQFHSMAERQFKTHLKAFQTDWGGEFRNLSSFFKTLGIIHRLSCPHTSEQNGFVERRRRHVVETGLTLLAQSGVPMRFWNFAFETATYLIYRMPSRTSSHISPLEQLFHHNLIFLSYASLDSNVSLTYVHIIHTKWIFALYLAYFSGIAHLTMATNVLIPLPTVFTLLGMSGSTRHVYHFSNHVHLPTPHLHLILTFPSIHLMPPFLHHQPNHLTPTLPTPKPQVHQTYNLPPPHQHLQSAHPQYNLTLAYQNPPLHIKTKTTLRLPNLPLHHPPFPNHHSYHNHLSNTHTAVATLNQSPPPNLSLIPHTLELKLVPDPPT